ncbi:MAG: US12 family protein [Planctomycetes bacterium]|nr:US12 family protein [Planctomycetota bacterium]
MQDNNPYRSLEAPPAAFAVASERAAFLKKVYGILLLGVLGFAATLFACATVPALTDLTWSIAELIYGRGLVGWAIYLGVFLGGSWLVQSVAEKRPINVVAFAAWVVVMGLLVAPIVLIASQAHGAEIIQQASALTAVVFGGLTVFVLWTGKDFSWLRGILFTVMLGLVATALLGALIGFTIGLWFSALVVIMSAGYILYRTSVILHHMPTSMAMSAAIMLFTDVVLLFKHILILLMNSRD